jgi:hypothetical protein
MSSQAVAVCGESRMHGGNGGDGETGHRYRALSLPTLKPQYIKLGLRDKIRKDCQP